MTTPVTTYFSQSQGREVPIADMPYPRLKATIDKVARETGGGPSPVLDALRAELARRPAPDPNGPQPAPRQAAPPARSVADRSPTEALPRDAKIGDNAPPSDSEELNARLEREHPTLITAAADLELAAAKLPKEVQSDEDVAAINAWVVKAQGVKRSAENERTEANKPVLALQRGINAFFGGIRDNVDNRVKGLEARKVPYLRAKQAREEAERRQRAEELRRAEEGTRQREEAARRAREAAAAEAAAVEERLRAASAAEDVAALEAQAVAANRAAQTATAAVEQAEKDLRAVGKAVDREEKILSGQHATHVLGKTSGGGANSTVVTVYRPDVHNRDRLIASLGPLGQYISAREVDDALARAAKADPRPAVPGVDWLEDHESRTRATRA